MRNSKAKNVLQFSIVVPAYNAGATLKETLSSISDQSFSDYEVIIVNDGSRDATGKIADTFAHQHVNASVIHQENGGSGAAINTGLYAAQGNYICICSSDDQLTPDCLRQQQLVIERHPDFHLFTTAGYHFNEEERWERPFFNTGKWKTSHEITLRGLLETRFFGSGITFSREAAIDAGGYAVSVYAEDFDFYLRMLLKDYRMWYSNHSCVRQRVSPVQKSANAMLIKESVLRSIENALSDDKLTADKRLILQEGLSLSEEQLSLNQGMLAQRAAANRVIDSIPGKKMRSLTRSLLRVLSPVYRPIRRLMARFSNSGKSDRDLF